MRDINPAPQVLICICTIWKWKRTFIQIWIAWLYLLSFRSNKYKQHYCPQWQWIWILSLSKRNWYCQNHSGDQQYWLLTAYHQTNVIGLISILLYRKVSNIRRTLMGNKLVVGAAPTASSFSNLTPCFNGLGKNNRKTRRETFMFWDWVRLILDNWRYSFIEIAYVLQNDRKPLQEPCDWLPQTCVLIFPIHTQKSRQLYRETLVEFDQNETTKKRILCVSLVWAARHYAKESAKERNWS